MGRRSFMVNTEPTPNPESLKFVPENQKVAPASPPPHFPRLTICPPCFSPAFLPTLPASLLSIRDICFHFGRYLLGSSEWNDGLS